MLIQNLFNEPLQIADVSAEEIFNMFFGGGFPSSTIYVRRNHNQHNRYRHTRHGENTSQEEPNLYQLFFQLMPVLLLFLLSIMSSYLTPDPAFSLVRTKYVDLFLFSNFVIPKQD